MADAFVTPDSELPRDRWGRPLITPPDGGEPVGYQRVTTFVGALEDTYHLSLWQQRMVAYGMGQRRDLQLAAAAIRDPKDRFEKRTLNDLAKSAIDAAKGSAAATTGTALHSLSERVDRGEDLGYVPEEYVADLDAYRRLMVPFEIVEIETFCVVDDLRVGGTYDRILGVPESAGLFTPDGRPAFGNFIGDLKTGGIDFGIGKIAMQLGVYSRGTRYDHRDGSRHDLPDVSQNWGIVMHLPAGTGEASLHWVNIGAGWVAASEIATRVHAWRKTKGLSTQFAAAVTGDRILSLVEQIKASVTYDEMRAVFATNKAAWTPGLTSLADATARERGWK